MMNRGSDTHRRRRSRSHSRSRSRDRNRRRDHEGSYKKSREDAWASGGGDRYSKSRGGDRYSNSRYDDRYSPGGDRYGDRYSNSRYDDRYSRGGDRYGDRYSNSRYDDRYSRGDRYSSPRGGDRYSSSRRNDYHRELKHGGYDSRAGERKGPEPQGPVRRQNNPQWDFGIPFKNISEKGSDAKERFRIDGRPLVKSEMNGTLETPNATTESNQSGGWAIRPDVEYARYKAVERLRRILQDTSRKRLGIKVPRLAFERWLLEQVARPYHPSSGCDPCLRHPQSCWDTDVIRRELLAELPCRIFGFRQKKNPTRLYKNLKQWVDAGCRWIDKLSKSRDTVASSQTCKNVNSSGSVPMNKSDISADNVVEKYNTTSQVEDKDEKFVPVTRPSVDSSGGDKLQRHSFEGVSVEAHHISVSDNDGILIACTKAKTFLDNADVFLQDCNVQGIHRKRGDFTDPQLIEDQLKILRDECAPLFNKIVLPDVDFVCKTLSDAAVRVVTDLASLSAKEQVGESKIEIIEGGRHRGSLEGLVRVSFKDDYLELNLQHLTKLRTLYTIHNATLSTMANAVTADTQNVVQLSSNTKDGVEKEEESNGSIEKTYNPDTIRLLDPVHLGYNSNCDPDLKRFPDALYSLARRYHTFIGSDSGNMHAAASEGTFRCMIDEFEVCMESYGSPFNCFFQRFGSAFPDTDGPFGSVGSFFDYTPVEGSFECGPPYVQETMDRMAERIDVLLEQSQRPLSFIVFVPDWYDPPLPAKITMEKSKFLRADLVAPGNGHTYVVGLQHKPLAQGRKRYYKVPHGTHLYWMQNDAGFAKWPPTKEKLAKLQKALG